MIRYALKCDEDHAFDSWFQSAEAFDSLLAAGHVSCVICGSTKVDKAVMAPRLRTRDEARRPLSGPASPAELALANLRRKIEAVSDNVGKNFATEARAIHNGTAPERPIIGEATPTEAKSLIEDGVPVAPLPWQTRRAN
jgi:hypothetical protein